MLCSALALLADGETIGDTDELDRSELGESPASLVPKGTASSKCLTTLRLRYTGNTTIKLGVFEYESRVENRSEIEYQLVFQNTVRFLEARKNGS